ncbi:MAG: hypothetical protein ACREVI_13105 [Steroidobacteraceae bacterium]
MLPFALEVSFPHVHGPINLDTIVRTVELVPSEKGNFVLPWPA